MTPRDPGRRRFLVAAAAAIGVAVATPIVWALNRAGVSTPPTTLGAAGTTTTAAPTPTTTGAPTATAAATTTAPPTTEPPTTTTTTEEPTVPTSTATSLGPIPASIEAICVAGWGGMSAQGEFEEHVIERLTVHHTASRLDTNTRAPHHVRGHQRFHQRDRGWPDLAYHFIVDLNGHVYEGRPLWARGDTGTTYDPAGHFLVGCEGDFDQQEPSAAQVQTLVAMLAWASAEFGVDPSTVGGHRDWAATSCPGRDLYPLIETGSLLDAIQETLTAGAPSLSLLCGDQATARVADIEAGVL